MTRHSAADPPSASLSSRSKSVTEPFNASAAGLSLTSAPSHLPSPVDSLSFAAVHDDRADRSESEGEPHAKHPPPPFMRIVTHDSKHVGTREGKEKTRHRTHTHTVIGTRFTSFVNAVRSFFVPLGRRRPAAAAGSRAREASSSRRRRPRHESEGVADSDAEVSARREDAPHMSHTHASLPHTHRTRRHTNIHAHAARKSDTSHRTRAAFVWGVQRWSPLLQPSLWRHLWRAAPVALLHWTAALRRQLAAQPLLQRMADCRMNAYELLRLSSLPLWWWWGSRAVTSLRESSAASSDIHRSPRTWRRAEGVVGWAVWCCSEALVRVREGLMAQIDTLRGWVASYSSSSTLSSLSSSSTLPLRLLPSRALRLLLARLVMQLLRNYLKGVVFMDDTVAALNLRSTVALRNLVGWLSRLTAHTVLDMTLMSFVTALLCAQSEYNHGTSRSGFIHEQGIRCDGDAVRMMMPAEAAREAVISTSLLPADVSSSAPVRQIRVTVEGVLRGLVCGLAAAVVDCVVLPMLSQLALRAVITLCEGAEYVVMRRYVAPTTAAARRNDAVRAHRGALPVPRRDSATGISNHADDTPSDTKDIHHAQDGPNNIDDTQHITEGAQMTATDTHHTHEAPHTEGTQHTPHTMHRPSHVNKVVPMEEADRQAAVAAHRAVIRAILYRIVAGVVAQCVIEHPLGVLVELLRGRAAMHVTGLLTRYGMDDNGTRQAGMTIAHTADAAPRPKDMSTAAVGDAVVEGSRDSCVGADMLCSEREALCIEWGSCDWQAFILSLTPRSSTLDDDIRPPVAVSLLRWCGDVVHEELAMVWSSLEEVSGQAEALSTLRAHARRYVSSALSIAPASASASAVYRSAMAQSVELALRSLLACGPLFDGVWFSAVDKLLSFYVAVWIRLRRQTASVG